jgi:ethanolamine utilization microcompartment shell protein EutL
MKTRIIQTAVLASALAGGGAAIASEATQFDISPGATSRAEVTAELNRALQAGALSAPSALYGEVLPVSSGIRSRAEVHAEARIEARTSEVASQYIGS